MGTYKVYYIYGKKYYYMKLKVQYMYLSLAIWCYAKTTEAYENKLHLLLND